MSGTFNQTKYFIYYWLLDNRIASFVSSEDIQKHGATIDVFDNKREQNAKIVAVVQIVKKCGASLQ